MTREEKWWHAIGMLPDDMIEEALAWVPESRPKPNLRKIMLITAVAVVLLSFVGWAAKEWLFVPGFGIVPTYTDMGVNVYTTEERTAVGQYTLEGIVFTENEADPEENRLMLWLYCQDQEALQELPNLWVNGERYGFLFFRRNPNSSLGCYTYTRKHAPDFVWDNGEALPLEPISVTAEGTVVTIQPMKGTPPEPVGEPVEVQLSPAESGAIEQIRLTGEKYVSFLPLTDNVVMGNLHDPDALLVGTGAWDMAARGEFTIRYEDGTESSLMGFLSMDNADPQRVTGVLSDRYDRPVSAIAMDSVSVKLDYSMRLSEDVPAFTYAFPLMEVGESLSCSERMWSGVGLELWLTSVYRTEIGMGYTTELRNLTGDPMITDGNGFCLFYAGEGIVRNGYNTDEHELFQRSCTEIDGELHTGRSFSPKGEEYALTLEAGDPVILVLDEVTYTYAHPDGTPLGEIELD